MGVDYTNYFGPYVHLKDTVVEVVVEDSKPFLGCMNHTSENFTKETFCPHCGTKLEMIVTPVKKILKVSDLLELKYEQKGEEFSDLFFNVGYYVDRNASDDLVYLLQDIPDEIDIDKGGIVFEVTPLLLNSIRDVSNPTYAKYHELLNLLKELGLDHTLRIGYVGYWS